MFAISEVCGVLSVLSSAPVQEGHCNATLVYTPTEKYLNTSRQWTRIYHRDRLFVFDSTQNSSTSTNIFAVSSGNENKILLIIQNVTCEDSEKYYVTCNKNPIVLSRPYQLNITEGIDDAFSF